MSLVCSEDLTASPSPQRSVASPLPMHQNSPAPADRLPEQLDDFHPQQLAAMLGTEQRQWRGEYLHLQPELTSNHRFFLVQWLHAACFERGLNLSAFAIAVTLLDRVLAEVPVPICQAQLVTIACLVIAAKVDGPDAVNDIRKFQVRTQLWNPTFTVAQIGNMEIDVLDSLGWASHCATAADFLDRLLAVAGVGRDASGELLPDGVADAVRMKAQQLVFQSLLDSESLALKPSSIAAAAVLDGMNGLCSDQCWQDTYALFSCHLDEAQIQTAMELFTNNVRALGGEHPVAAHSQQQAKPAQHSPPAIKTLPAARDGHTSPIANNSPATNNSLADKAVHPWASPHSISPTSVIVGDSRS
mmetsp:Transcript_16462/g.49307  ORF Transcript_16462/g.49307 Transcript_16462/m.49307 type:complete len:358 (-) Transcript_16462:829-1902(-)